MGLFQYGRDLLLKALDNRYIESATTPFEATTRAIKSEDHRKLSKAYKNAAYVCAKKVAGAVAKAPLKLFVTKPKGRRLVTPTKQVSGARLKQLQSDSTLTRYVTKRMEIEEVTEHPFLDLMTNINPFFNYYDFLMLTDLNMELMGNAYWYVVDDALGKPAELWVIPAQFMWVVPDREKFIKAYVMMHGAVGARGLMRVPFDEQEIVHFKEPSPDSLYYGVSWLGAMSEAYNLQINIDRYDVAFFSNMARPDGILQAPQGAIITPAVYKQIKQEFRQRYSGVRNALTPMILQGGLEWQQTSQSPADLGLKDSRRDSLERMAMASGVPLAKLITENVNKANANAAQEDFLRDTVKPKLTLIQEKINEKIMPRYGPQFFVAFDEIIPEDKELLLKREETDVKNGIRTRNEIRLARGELPLPKGGDDVPPFPGQSADSQPAFGQTDPGPPKEGVGGVAVRGFAPPDLPFSERGARLSNAVMRGDDNRDSSFVTEYSVEGKLFCGEVVAPSWEQAQVLCDMRGRGEMVIGEHVENVELLSSPERTKQRDKDQRDIYYKAFEKKVDPLEKKFRKSIVEYFKTQERQVLANLRKFKSARKVVKVDEGNINNILFGSGEWKDIYREQMEQVYVDIAREAGEGAFKVIPDFRGVFDVANPEIQDIIGNRLDRISDLVNETTTRQLRDQLKMGIAAGEAIPDLAFRIGEVFEDAIGYRATMIARTETISGYAEASLHGYRQSGVVQQVEWIATRDARVRDDHMALDGKTIPLGGLFTFNSGTKTKGPGLSGVASQDINCRCAVAPVVEGAVTAPVGARQSPLGDAYLGRYKNSVDEHPDVLGLEKKKALLEKEVREVSDEAFDAYSEYRSLRNSGASSDIVAEAERRYRLISDPMDANRELAIRLGREIKKLKTNLGREMVADLLSMTNPKNLGAELSPFDVSPAEFPSESLEEMDKARDVFNRMGIPIRGRLRIVPLSSSSGRSYYDGTSIVLSKKADVRIIIHELGHWMEDNNASIKSRARTFLRRRTKGEEPVSLRKLTGQRGFGMDEMTFKDEFDSPYTGKIYEDGSTEVLSMGFEQMLTDPVGFAKRDRDYFDFIFSIMEEEKVGGA